MKSEIILTNGIIAERGTHHGVVVRPVGPFDAKILLDKIATLAIN
jgi:hypothetical protein